MSPGCSPALLDSGTVTTPEIPDEPTGSPTGAAARRGPLRPGDRVQLTDPRGRLHTITLAPGATFHTHKGYFRHDGALRSADQVVVAAVPLVRVEGRARRQRDGVPVSYTHLRAHETGRNLVCRLLLEKKKKKKEEKKKKKKKKNNKKKNNKRR